MRVPIWSSVLLVVMGLTQAAVAQIGNPATPGGVRLTYEIDRDDYVTSRLQDLLQRVRMALREAPPIPYSRLQQDSSGIGLRLDDPARIDEARIRLAALRIVPGNPAATGISEFDLAIENGVVRMTYSEAALAAEMPLLQARSIEVIARRIVESGASVAVRPLGDDRLVIDVPGPVDHQRIADLIGRTGQLTFHIVINPIQVPVGTQPAPGTIVMPTAEDPGLGYLLDAEIGLRGEGIVEARAVIEQRTNQPIVTITFDAASAKAFADLTRANVGRAFAIVLDNQVISAPLIQEAILGGSAIIQGNFTLDEANNLALLLVSGALPARLTLVEQATFGATEKAHRR